MDEVVEVKDKFVFSVDGRKIIAVCAVVVLMLSSFVCGSFLSDYDSTNRATPISINSCDFNGLSGADKNWFIGLEYSGGFCERMGLNSSYIVQKLDDGNIVGVPVCK